MRAMLSVTSFCMVFDIPLKTADDPKCSANVLSNSANACTSSTKVPLFALPAVSLCPLNACSLRARYKAATISLIRIPRFFFIFSLCFFVLMLLAKSRASSTQTSPKSFNFTAQSMWFFDLPCLSIAQDRLARSVNPVVTQGLCSEQEYLSKRRQDQQNKCWSLVLPASHSMQP